MTTTVHLRPAVPAIPGGDPRDPVEQGIPKTLNAKGVSRTAGPIADNLQYRVDVITERGNIISTVECLVDTATQVCIDGAGSSGPDFTLSAAPSALVLTPGTSGTSTITVTSLNGYSAPVTRAFHRLSLISTPILLRPL